MASKTCSSLFLTLNLFFFALVSARETWPGPNPNPRLRPTNISGGSNTSDASCPRDELKLGVCANLLNRTVNVTLGQPPVTPCCTLIQGLIDLEAAVCLCTALRANILGFDLDISVAFSYLINICSREVPTGFICR
ncbi:14 kDa proline-rich protein [Spatholobus suberectus]|nr:14 kDa proline-rich protein [Spatholobus suberectus]